MIKKIDWAHSFQNRSIIGNLEIIAQLIIVLDLQTNHCKVLINLLTFSLLTKVQFHSKVMKDRLRFGVKFI